MYQKKGNEHNIVEKLYQKKYPGVASSRLTFSGRTSIYGTTKPPETCRVAERGNVSGHDDMADIMGATRGENHMSGLFSPAAT